MWNVEHTHQLAAEAGLGVGHIAGTEAVDGGGPEEVLPQLWCVQQSLRQKEKSCMLQQKPATNEDDHSPPFTAYRPFNRFHMILGRSCG